MVNSPQHSWTRITLLSLATMTLLILGGCLEPVSSDDPLERPGPFTVTQSDQQIPYQGSDDIDARLYTPDTESPAALLIFLPGFGASFSLYSDYLIHLASHGYLVLGMNFPGDPFALDSHHDLKAQQVLAAVEFMRSLHPTLKIALAGHSMGGKLAFYAAALDPGIAVVMALDPVNAGGPPCFLFPDYCANYPVAPNPGREQAGILADIEATASLIMRSAPDPATNPEAEFNAEWFYYGSDGKGSDAVPSPALYYDLGSFAHAAYVPLLPSDTSSLIKRTMVAWLQQQIQNKEMREYLTGNRIAADIEAGRILRVESR